MFGAPYPTRRSQHSRHLASQWQRPMLRSVLRSNPSHTTTCSSAVCETRHRLARRLTKHHPPLACARWLVHIAVLHRITVSTPILAHRKHPCTRSRTHPPPARIHDHRAGSVLLRAPCHMRRSRSPRSSLNHSTYAALLFLVQDLTRRSHCPRWSRSTHGAFLLLQVPTLFLAGRSFFLLASRCVARHARPHARTLSRTRTDDRRTNDATCGPQAWLSGSLHYGGIRSVRPSLRRAPLLATPIATPLQCGRP